MAGVDRCSKRMHECIPEAASAEKVFKIEFRGASLGMHPSSIMRTVAGVLRWTCAEYSKVSCIDLHEDRAYLGELSFSRIACESGPESGPGGTLCILVVRHAALRISSCAQRCSEGLAVFPSSLSSPPVVTLSAGIRHHSPAHTATDIKKLDLSYSWSS